MRPVISYIKFFTAILVTCVYLIAVLPFMLIKDRWFNNIARSWSRILLFILGVEVEIKGKFPHDDNSYVVSANHSSLIDIPIVIAYLPYDTRIVYKQELEKIVLFGWVLKKSPYVGINRSNARNAMESIKNAAEQIKDGASILLFPEGTRSETGEIGEFKRGAFMLADKSDTKILPIRIIDAYKIMDNKKMITPTKVKLIIGETVKLPKPLNKVSELECINQIRDWTINAK